MKVNIERISNSEKLQWTEVAMSNEVEIVHETLN